MISTVIPPTESLTKLAHGLVRNRVKPGDAVIDATLGNGHDTWFLLDSAKPDGTVFGFDIQQAALDSTRRRLQAHPFAHRVSLIQASHAEMNFHVPPKHHGKISVIMFNLGYLPGGDKKIITEAKTTVSALTCASGLLCSGGNLSIMVYPGHEGGKQETEAVDNWCRTLDPDTFTVTLYQNQPDNLSAPKLFVVNRKA